MFSILSGNEALLCTLAEVSDNSEWPDITMTDVCLLMTEINCCTVIQFNSTNTDNFTVLLSVERASIFEKPGQKTSVSKQEK